MEMERPADQLIPSLLVCYMLLLHDWCLLCFSMALSCFCICTCSIHWREGVTFINCRGITPCFASSFSCWKEAWLNWWWYFSSSNDQSVLKLSFTLSSLWGMTWHWLYLLLPSLGPRREIGSLSPSYPPWKELECKFPWLCPLYPWSKWIQLGVSSHYFTSIHIDLAQYAMKYLNPGAKLNMKQMSLGFICTICASASFSHTSPWVVDFFAFITWAKCCGLSNCCHVFGT